jgi:hypothetical protein
MARLLRESDGKPIQEVLATVLDQAWEDFLRDKVQNSLMNLARPSPAI